jgi:hypothetical protein
MNNPKPWRLPLVEKSYLHAFGNSDFFIPIPESRTCKHIDFSFARDGRAVIQILPPLGIASIAFRRRFNSILTRRCVGTEQSGNDFEISVSMKISFGTFL